VCRDGVIARARHPPQAEPRSAWGFFFTIRPRPQRKQGPPSSALQAGDLHQMTRHLLSLVALVVTACPLLADNWPAGRAADGLGRCAGRALPLTWSADTGENIRWKIALPGPGNSTPIIWGERIFLTQATAKGQKRGLLCLDRKDGKTLWERYIDYKEK